MGDSEMRVVAIAAIREHQDKRFVVEHTPEDIRELYEGMASPGVRRLTGLPGMKNPKSFEDVVVRGLSTVDVMTERYRAAMDFLAWFDPAWQRLSDRERVVLNEFYSGWNQRSGATRRVAPERWFHPL